MSATHAGAGPRQIVVVDDNEDIRELIAFILNDAGFEPLLAHDGDSGIALIEKFNPDLVLLDVMMPGKSGHQILAEIRHSIRVDIASVPIILISAKSQMEDIERGLALGADSYIIKPFKAGALIAEIERVIGLSKRFLAASQ